MLRGNLSRRRYTYSSVYLVLAGIISSLLCPPHPYLTVTTLFLSLFNLVQFSVRKCTWRYRQHYVGLTDQELRLQLHSIIYHPVPVVLLISVKVSPSSSQLFILNLIQLTVETVDDGSPHKIPLLFIYLLSCWVFLCVCS